MVDTDTETEDDDEVIMSSSVKTSVKTSVWREDTETHAVYREDMLKQYFAQEEQHTPSPGFMEGQAYITDTCRTNAVERIILTTAMRRDWLRPETRYLAVHLMDRYLSAVCTDYDTSCLATTALVLAIKMEEEEGMCTPDDVVLKSGMRCTLKEVLRTEHGMVRALGWHLTTPTAFHFLQVLHTAILSTFPPNAARSFLLSRMLCISDATLAHSRFSNYLPSQRAAACALYAVKEDGRLEWDGSEMQRVGKYTEAELFSCCQEIVEVLSTYGIPGPVLDHYGGRDLHQGAALLPLRTDIFSNR